MIKNSLFILVAFFMASCSEILTDSNELEGSWEWIQSYGGIAGQTLTPEKEGVDQQLIFFKHRRFLLISNGETTRDGRYELTDLEIAGQKRPAVKFESDNWDTFYEISNDTLYLTPNCMDCFFDIYIRR